MGVLSQLLDFYVLSTALSPLNEEIGIGHRVVDFYYYYTVDYLFESLVLRFK